MKKLYLILIVLILFTCIHSEISEKFQNPSLFKPSIFNLNNITMNQSMSFSAGVGSNKQSFYQSMYTNHFNYRISSKLNFKLDLNFVNFGTATYEKDLQFSGNGDNDSTVLPEFSLVYKPSDSFSMVIEYRNVSLNQPGGYPGQWLRK